MGPPPHRRSLGHRRGLSDPASAPVVENMYPEEGYTNYNGLRHKTNSIRRTPIRQKEQFIDEEEEYCSPNYEGDPFNDTEFEMVGVPGMSRQHTDSPLREPRRASSRRPEVRKFRIKAHAAEDTRYIIVEPTIEYSEFERKMREKFGFTSQLKIKMQDDGDMITMVDQEDLDLLLGSAKENAMREGGTMGKMEVSGSFTVLVDIG